MIELTEEQQRAVEGTSPPLQLVDPRTKKAYVLVEVELYERLRGMLEQEDGFDMREVASLVERAMQEDDAGDPTLAYYQQKYGRRP
jgi:hypothetical protein